MRNQRILNYTAFAVGLIAIVLISTDSFFNPMAVEGLPRNRKKNTTGKKSCGSYNECYLQNLTEIAQEVSELFVPRGKHVENDDMDSKDPLRKKVTVYSQPYYFHIYRFFFSDEVLNQRITNAVLKVPIEFEYTPRFLEHPHFHLELLEMTSPKYKKQPTYSSYFDYGYKPSLAKSVFPAKNEITNTHPIFWFRINVIRAVRNFLRYFESSDGGDLIPELILDIRVIRDYLNFPRVWVRGSNNTGRTVWVESSTVVDAQNDENPYLEITIEVKDGLEEKKLHEDGHKTRNVSLTPNK